MADVGDRVIGPTLLTAAATTLYTVPAATKLYVRSIHVCNVTANASGLTLSVGADATGTRFYSGLQIPANGSLDWSGNLIVRTGEIIQAYGSIASALTLMISGVLET